MVTRFGGHFVDFGSDFGKAGRSLIELNWEIGNTKHKYRQNSTIL